MNPLGQMILDLFFLFDINVYNFSATLKNLFFCLKKKTFQLHFTLLFSFK